MLNRPRTRSLDRSGMTHSSTCSNFRETFSRLALDLFLSEVALNSLHFQQNFGH